MDVGCGSGLCSQRVKNTCPDIKLYGLDVSKYAAEHASQFAEVYAGNLKDAKYSDNQFDVIATYHVIEHVKDPIPFLKNIKRILKNGLLILGTPDFDSGCARRFGSQYRLLHDPSHITLFTNDSMHRFFKRS